MKTKGINSLGSGESRRGDKHAELARDTTAPMLISLSKLTLNESNLSEAVTI